MAPRMYARLALGLLVLPLLSACDNGLFHEPAPPATTLRIAYAITEATGANAEAYAQTNVLWVRVRSGEEVRLEQTYDFDASASETQVPVDVPLAGASETLSLEVELRRDSEPLFRGAASVEVEAGGATDAVITLVPVPASVQVQPGTATLSSFGETLPLGAAVLFATGDTVKGAAITWTSLDPQVAAVSGNGVVTAVSDGTARIEARHDDLAGTATITVLAVVKAITVTPATTNLLVGTNMQLEATLSDALGNTITGRPVVWTSSSPSVVTVSPTGVVTGVAVGTARISAASGGVTGSATINVVPPPPTVATLAATVDGPTAVLSGTVNPQGSPTQAWFEYGSDPSFQDFVTTQAQDVGSGAAEISVTQDVGSLTPGTTYYYRMVASNAGGTSHGDVVTFEVVEGPPFVVTQPGDPIFTYGFTMRGTIVPNTDATTVYFEWSLDPKFAPTRTQSTKAQLVGGTNAIAVSDDVIDVISGRYYYRIVGVNFWGTSVGEILFVDVPLSGGLRPGTQPRPDIGQRNKAGGVQ